MLRFICALRLLKHRGTKQAKHRTSSSALTGGMLGPLSSSCIMTKTDCKVANKGLRKLQAKQAWPVQCWRTGCFHKCCAAKSQLFQNKACCLAGPRESVPRSPEKTPPSTPDLIAPMKLFEEFKGIPHFLHCSTNQRCSFDSGTPTSDAHFCTFLKKSKPSMQTTAAGPCIARLVQLASRFLGTEQISKK